MDYDNPAARLLAILQHCKSLPRNASCRQAWREILNTGQDDALLMSRLGKVMELPQITIKTLQEFFPNREATWTHWNSQVSSAFVNQTLSGTWESFINHIDQHTITYLQMSAELLQSKNTTRVLEQTQLDKLREELGHLLDDIFASEIDFDVKKYLIKSIREILINIDEYKLTGALTLLHTVESMVGHAHLNAPYRRILTDTELGKRILDSLGAVANTVTVAVGIPQLTQTIQLLSGS